MFFRRERLQETKGCETEETGNKVRTNTWVLTLGSGCFGLSAEVGWHNSCCCCCRCRCGCHGRPSAQAKEKKLVKPLRNIIAFPVEVTLSPSPHLPRQYSSLITALCASVTDAGRVMV